MSIPSGARSVTYHMNGFNPTTEQEGPFFTMTVEGLGDSSTAELDAAGESAANAALASMETAFPAVTFSSFRSYTCEQPGDTWPSV